MTIDAVVERIADGGNLLRNLGLLQDINTWQTSQEVWQAWQAGAPIEGVNTANMAIYRIVNDEAVFDLLGKEGNLFIDDRFRESAYNGIARNEFFLPQDAMKQHVLSAISAGRSVTIRYSGLNIKIDSCSQNYRYIEASGCNTEEEKKLFSAVYGTDNHGRGRKVYLLREAVVKKQLKHKTDNLIARACYFSSGQNFGASVRSISGYYGAVRGVRLGSVVAEGDAQKSSPLTDAYNVVLAGIDTLTGPQAFQLYTALQPRVMITAGKQMQQ